MLLVCYLFAVAVFYLSWISDVVKAAGEPGCIRHFVVILLSHKTVPASTWTGPAVRTFI
jgi:hypothetical protein